MLRCPRIRDVVSTSHCDNLPGRVFELFSLIEAQTTVADHGLDLIDEGSQDIHPDYGRVGVQAIDRFPS
jgi:hypothetical protein